MGVVPKPTIFLGTRLLTVVLNPQHLTLVSFIKTHNPFKDATLLVNPLTWVGIFRSIIVPSPTYPNMLLPQHFTAPSIMRAQDVSPTSDISTTLFKLNTSVGVSVEGAIPIPNWPNRLLPQHLTLPLLSKAQACSPPIETVTMPLSKLGIDIAVELFTGGPPQHFTLPATRIAQSP